MEFRWKIRKLMEEASRGRDRRLTYADISDKSGVSSRALSRMATQGTTRVDLPVADRLLTYFQERIDRSLNTSDLIEWRGER